jgi:hypothetical protein
MQNVEQRQQPTKSTEFKPSYFAQQAARRAVFGTGTLTRFGFARLWVFQIPSLPGQNRARKLKSGFSLSPDHYGDTTISVARVKYRY